MPSKVFPGKFSSLADISDFIIEISRSAGFNEKDTYQIQLAVDEACSNIIEHGYGEDLEGDIECFCQPSEEGITIILKDTGRIFSPDEIPELEVGVPLEELGERGAGLFLIKKIMDEIQFEFSKSGGTTLTMKKKK